MKILHISLAYGWGTGGIYSDLAEALAAAGYEVSVVSVDAKTEATKIDFQRGVRVLRVKSPNAFNVSKIKKGIIYISLPFIVKSAVKKFFAKESFDLILFEAPPVTMGSVVRYCMKRFGCPSLLMQKDIFPQNAVDLHFFKKDGIIYKYFRRLEVGMLKTATLIGCMSQGNIDFLLKNNPWLKKEKLIYFPNTAKIDDRAVASEKVFEKHDIPVAACKFLFGGNMGKPQYVELLCSAMKRFSDSKTAYFLCIGSGTEAPRIKDFIERNKIGNAKYISQLSREDFEAVAKNCDVGLVTLDPRFTIPNYPSKTLSYMESAMPILAATDPNTDYRNLIESQANCGLWSLSSDENAFFANIEKLASDPSLRKSLGANGRKYFLENFTVKTSVDILERLFDDKGKCR